MCSSSPYIYKGVIWQVINCEGGICSKIMNRIIEQVFVSLSYYSKVLAIRLDFHCNTNTATNTHISDYFKQLKSKLHRRYQCAIGYVWVREQSELGTTPHYHTAVLLNGHRVCHPKKIVELIQTDTKANPFLHFSLPKNSFYLITREDSQLIQALIYRLSYLAKNDTKKNRSSQTNRFQVSRNKPHEPKYCAVLGDHYVNSI
ncbi:TPA: YagK/YfjJ domain-containing protein [Photobacterium damselae]|uniref:YagK/YfjJ domain-containing protein n=2 Tax=Photobacterium damselae TaxID=38293 RepID=UPI0002DD2AAE|nr:inovirus-type Gp2 protein [Photobacterium damselae]OLQ80910.1 hypothetical protein BEI67_13220 [Photobacterium damselae subsp. piscicida]TFZ46795.1 inovirus Gp2 family protein [Photobacterium damselae subsp. piscicida]TJZ95294.1 inovirus Gp2 family protein [Photobacterium damselae subsp. piscicida]BBC40672.1 hypothetical protein PDPE_1-01512 [Photobacterium damselae subsp. piscicida]